MVTIVVLLILTGITVNMTVGDNGLITMAKNIKENIEKAEDEGQKQVDAVKNSEYLEDGAVAKNDSVAPTINSIDVIKLSDTSFRVKVNATEVGSGIAKVEYSIDGGKSYVTPNYVKDTSYVFSNLEGNFEKYNIKVRVTDASGNTSDSSQQYQMITEKLIPSGFYYVGGSKYSGVVISDNSSDKEKYYGKDVVGTDLQGNQFVWIPCITDSSSAELQYARTEWGVEDDNGTKAIKDELTLTDSSVTYSDVDIANGINADVSKEIVAQINEEKTSVSKYGGYYIGRYEVGKNGDTAVVKYNQTPYASITWNTAYGLAKKIITNSEATSYLCSSYAWDTAVNFIQNNSMAKNYATSMEVMNENWNNNEVRDGNGNVIKGTSYQIINTGLTSSYCNLFDIGGNTAEFTTEINPGTSETAIIRGGNDRYWSFPAGSRWDIASNNSFESYGFRATLFLK